MEAISIIAATLGVAWASGINLYAAVFMLGLLANTGSIALPPDLEVVAHPGVMAAAGFMYCVEFFADKVPGVDNGWDVIHSFIRIPVGALLAAGTISALSPEAELIGLLLGGTIAAGTHFTKAGTRVLVNTSPEPFSNIAISLGEDFMVILGLWAALNHPVLFLIALVLFIALVIWLAPKLWRGIKKVFAKIASWFGGKTDTADRPGAQPAIETKAADPPAGDAKV